MKTNTFVGDGETGSTQEAGIGYPWRRGAAASTAGEHTGRAQRSHTVQGQIRSVATLYDKEFCGFFYTCTIQ